MLAEAVAGAENNHATASTTLTFGLRHADYNKDHANRTFIFARVALSPGGRAKACVALQRHLQIQLLALHEAVQHEKQQESVQGAK